jgi:diguanylate cyclase (GGDEF)-like protein
MQLIFENQHAANRPLMGMWKSFFTIALSALLAYIPSTWAAEQPNESSAAIKTTTSFKLTALGLTPEEQTWLASHPIIRVGVRHGYAPIEYISEGNQFRGIAVDYLRKLEGLLGVSFKKIDVSDTPATNSIDMLSGVTNTKSIKNNGFVALSKPYLTFSYAIYTHKKNKNIQRLKDLQGKRIAIFKKSAVSSQLLARLPSAKLVNMDIAEDAFSALEMQTVDAYIGNEMIVDYVANSQGVNFIKKVGYTPYQAQVSMAVRQDWPHLQSILQKSLLALESDQEEILKKWDLTSQKKNIYLFWSALGALFLVISLILFKSYRLKQTIKVQNKLSQERIWHQANFDFLTNLPNRMMFNNRLQEEIKKSNRSALPLGLLFLDLDNFKQINDQLGHAIGDRLIAEVAKRIERCVRSIDTTARIGGDEFTVIMGELTDINAVEKTSAKILARLEAPFHINSHVIYVTASIGITIFPNDTHRIEELLIFADQAMYEAKRLGRNRYQFFTASMQRASTNRHEIMTDLRYALAHDQLVMFYQPIVDLNNLALHKAEALLRWQHPTKGLIEPHDFIPIAEETDIINQLGDWVFNQVLKDVVDLRASQHPDFQISINVSPRQFMNENHLMSWLTKIHEHGLKGDVISIEITEGLLLQPTDSVKHILAEFIAAGADISIDDFGTGYSALGYLKKFNVDYVKLDKSFVRNIESDSDNMILCEAIISMAHKLRIKVIAEGIETPAQQTLLKQFGCDFGQGYLLAKPQNLEAFKAFLKSAE